MPDSLPTKKQRELLQFIDGFIKGNGYGPSYREIMRALGYKSVSTVAVHVDGLIMRGYLLKRDHSARSLEIALSSTDASVTSADDESIHIAWLRRRIVSCSDNLEKETLQAALTIVQREAA